MKKFLLLALCLIGGTLSSQAQGGLNEVVYDDPIDATPIESLSGYQGSDPYVFDMKARKYYARNNQNLYEECGLYPEVSTLKVAGGGVTEIQYIATNASMTTMPYINTGYVHKANTRIVMECDIQAADKNYQAPFGARSGYGANMFVFFWRFDGQNSGCFARNGEVRGTAVIPTGEKIKVDASGLTLNVYKDGQTDPCATITGEGESKGGITPMYIFDLCHENHPDNSFTLMKLYSFKIFEGETLVMDLVPVVDAEGIGALKDKVTGSIFKSANNEKFELSPDGQEIAADAGITVYKGKLVINTKDNHEYKWNGTAWEDKGSVYKPITDTDYQNMNNWTCRWGYEETYGHIENSGNNNFFNPYNGKDDWEPYQCKVTGLTKGETYRVSFNFSSQGWNSWSNYTLIPFFVDNNWDFNRGFVPSGAGGEVLGYVGLPQAVLDNKPYSFTFTADGTEAVLAIQFGVGDDNKDFFFHFDNLNIEFVDYPVKYQLHWTDPNKYTALEYIESTGAARENVFTTPYVAKASTEVDVKFQSYSGGDWRAIFSGRNGSDAGNGISLYQNGNQTQFGYFVGGYRNDNHADYPGHNQDITVAATLGNLNVNGTDYPTGQTTFNASSRNISFFANPEWDQPFRGRIYYLTIKEEGETVYDFQPVIRHDGVFGFYDAATATFVEPAKGTLDGYGYKKLDDKAYVTYNKDTRLVIVGSTAQYLPEVQNLDGASFEWTSADETIATVAADGTVTGVKAGKVMITVTTTADQGWTASYELTVSEPDYKRHDADGVGYAIVTGGNGWGDSPLSALLDNDASTKFGCSGVDDAWAIIIASKPVAVTQYSLVTGNDTYGYPGRNPVSWKIEGSNDNQTWTVIDEQVKSYKLQAKNREEFEFPVNGTETYKFFKFTATQIADAFQLGEFWINAQAHNYDGENVTIEEPTCTAEGKAIYECTECKSLYIKSVYPTGHQYEHGVCKTCNAKVSEVVLLPNRGEENTPYYAKFRYANGVSDEEYVDVETGWTEADFDDSAWGELMMPLGSFGPYHTRWVDDYNTFWFRRHFYVENPAEFTTLTLKVTHDDDCAVFLNGTKVWNEFDWTGGEDDWRTVKIDPSLLVAGDNVLAMYIEQNWGGAYCDFSLEAKMAAPVTIGDAGYATFVAPFDVDFSTNDAVSAFAVQKQNGYVNLEPVTTVPAGAAVVVKADAAGTFDVSKTTDAALGTNNDLKAAAADIVADGTQYVLAKPENKVGFFRVNPNTTIAKGKGYLESTAGIKAFFFEGDVETAIENVNANVDANAAIYNMAGQRMSKAQKGVNIINGKKVLK
ncbi:MAG: Ig-like domain-containing protein [Bacteroidaceae bacterium]|nr:Ig-like domain-containing protein [Bacteroidaceae bacterium]